MTLSITWDTQYGQGVPPAVRLVVTSTTTAPNPVPVNSLITLWRVHPDGTQHKVLTTTRPRVIPSSWTGLDYHAPYNVMVTYRVTVGAASATTDAYLPCPVTWLIDPTDPALSYQVDRVRGIGARSKASRAGEMTPVGGDAVFIGDGRRDGFVGSITFECPDEDRLTEFLDRDGVVLINTPGQGWRIRSMWVMPGQLEYVNPGAAFFPYDVVSVPFKQAAEPDVDVSSVWSNNDATAALVGVKNNGLAALYENNLAFQTNTRRA